MGTDQIAPEGGSADDWKELKERHGGDTPIIDIPLKELDSEKDSS